MDDLVEQKAYAAATAEGDADGAWTVREHQPQGTEGESRLLLDSLRNVLQSLQRLELFEFEEYSVEELRKRLVPFVERGARLSMQLLGRAIDRYTEIGAEELVDVCVVARVQVSAGGGALLEGDDALETLSHCNHTRGAVIAAIYATDEAICRHEGWESLPRTATSLPSGITARRAYARFRALLRNVELDTSLTVERRLQQVTDAIQAMVDPPMGKKLRVNDRIQLRRTRQQIVKWLDEPNRDELEAEAHWNNVVTVSELLMMINHRQELLQHDLAVLERCALLLGAIPALEVDRELITDLATLQGRDPELDRWIAILERGINNHLAGEISRVLGAVRR